MRLFKLYFTILTACFVLFISNAAQAHGAVVEAGDVGSYVEEVQTLLQEKGYYEGDISGVCDDATVEAIKAFQHAHNLDVDGIAGPQTMRVLRPLNQGDIDLSNARVMTVTAYAYSPQDPGMGAYTASGTLLRRGVLAVDPSVIPIGTHVYIPDYGEAVAEDIGWSIQGATIDIAFDTHEEAIYFGRQVIEIYLL